MENDSSPPAGNGKADPLHIKLPEKAAYALGDTASCLFYSTFAQFLMYFYTDVFGISAAAVGTMFLVTRLWDTLNDPLMGMIADRTETRFGKFRPWLIWIILPLIITGVLTFTTPDLGMTGKLIWAYATYTLVGMAYTAINVPYSALMGVMTSHSEERTVLSSFRFLGAFSGSLIVQGTLLWLVQFLGQGNEQRGFQLTILLYGIVAGLFFMCTFAFTKERIKPPVNQESTVKQDLKDLLRNGPWLALCVISVMTLVYISIRNGAVVYYFKYYIGDTQLASSFLVVGTVASLVGVSMTKYIVRIFKDKRQAYIGLSLINAVGMAAFYFVGPESFVLMYVLQVLGGALSAPLMPLTWSMFADTADYAEYKFGRRSTGLVFSAGTFSQKFGWTVGGAMAGYLLALYGFKANIEQAPDTLNGIRLLMSFIPAAVGIVTAAMVYFYKIDRKMEMEIEQAVLQHRAESARAD
jgi:GPH family glycoside/pentoside/hexuronide:cation symporter